MSAVMQQPASTDLRSELIDWQRRLEAAAQSTSENVELGGLLREVSATIERLSQPSSYGVCQVCHELIGKATITADPMARNCLDCFTPKQLEELEQDLGRAWLVQGELLPEQDLKFNGWEVSWHYEPAGPVSGDYCDLVHNTDGDLYFLVGDVSGKGVAASLLMSRLHAIFRSLLRTGLQVTELVEQANQLFAESTMRPYYATLVCGRANRDGAIEICNAGHCAPLLIGEQGVESIAATSLPVGMFCEERYSSTHFRMNKGDRLFIYTDGLSEARNPADDEYGADRLQLFLGGNHRIPAAGLINRVLGDLRGFASGKPLTDDLTVMAIEMVGH